MNQIKDSKNPRSFIQNSIDGGQSGMKIFLLVILVIHGIIHILGFVKAFQLAEVNGLTQFISKPIGVIWLLVSFLFIVTAILYLMKHNSWWMIATAAIVISQILITLFWQDAKFGTIPNLVIFIGITLAFASWSFNQQIEKELNSIILAENLADPKIVTEDMLVGLPKPVQNWLRNSKVVGRETISKVYVKQSGVMRLKPEDKKWAKSKAEQWTTVSNPAFLWQVNMSMWGIPIAGRDKFQNGKGELLIKLASLFPVAQVKGNEKVDQSSMHRFLMELPWYPTAALSEYIKWEGINESTAKATMSYKGEAVSAVYYFTDKGEFIKSSAWRYKETDENAKIVECIGEAKEHKVMNGIKIPTKLEITWMLEDGPYTWYKFEIEEISFLK